MKIENGSIIFSSGREVPAGDYLCITLEGKSVATAVDEQYYPYFNYIPESGKRLSPAERKELSEFAINLWQQFGIDQEGAGEAADG